MFRLQWQYARREMFGACMLVGAALAAAPAMADDTRVSSPPPSYAGPYAGGAPYGPWPPYPCPPYPHYPFHPAYPMHPAPARPEGQAGERPPGQQPGALDPSEGQPFSTADQFPTSTAGTSSAPAAPASLFTQSTGGAGAVSVPNAYIDPAQVFTHFRLRFDAGFDNTIPDRAEFFYAKCGCFGTPDAKGPPLAESSLDFYDLRGYLELAATENVSGFVEVPVRFIEFDQNIDAGGLADMNAGFKAVLLSNGEDFLTLQLTTYLPTGDADRGLGTENISVEPALLFYEQYTDRASFYGEARYWIPLDGSDFAGNIVRYGLGTGYDLGYGRRGGERVTALMEVVGWTVVDGMLFDGGRFLALQPLVGDAAAGAAATQSAEGDTIINLKLGLRYTLGLNSLAATWGHALTEDTWYEDIFRLEYRRAF